MTKPSPSLKATAAETSDSRFKGVRKRKWGKWVSEIRLPNSRQRIWLGSYDSADKAARAFDAALFCLRGPSATFNFPHNPPDIPRAALLSRSEIQSAAAKFANSEPRPYSDYPDPTPTRPDNTLHKPSFFDDPHTPMGTGDYVSDFDFFPEYNSFFHELIDASATTSSSFDYGEETFEQDSSLWNF